MKNITAFAESRPDPLLTREAVLASSQCMADRPGGMAWHYANLTGFKLTDIKRAGSIVRLFESAFARRASMSALAEFMRTPGVIRAITPDVEARVWGAPY